MGVIGPIILDAGPFAFRKDLLLHDAHRHPYIERLGLLYMMKLRFGNSFATRNGSCWRLLFTLALMPWFRKYRIRSYAESLEDKMDENESKAEMSRMLRSIEPQENSAIVNRSLELEVEVLRDRVRELEAEIARVNAPSSRNQLLEASFKDETL